jgi:hypothetical protein
MSESHRDVIGLAMDPSHGAISSRSLSRTMRRLHGGAAAAGADGVVDGAVGTIPTVVSPRTFEERLDDDVKQMYRRPWNKLEIGMKWTKVREFCEAFSVSNKLTDGEKALLTTTMRRALDAKLLNTKTQVEYSAEGERVTTIYGLHELPKNDKGDRRFGLVARGAGAARTTRKKKTAGEVEQGAITVPITPVVI